MSGDREAVLDDILAEVLGLPRTTIRPDLSGETCATWDSMNHIRIALSLDERLGVRLSLDEMETSMSRRALLDRVLAEERRETRPGR
jgi:acyl carrier protein